MGFKPQLHSWQANVLPPLHIGGAYPDGNSVDQYAALHQHYDSIQAALSMSLWCEPIRQYFCLQCLKQHCCSVL